MKASSSLAAQRAAAEASGPPLLRRGTCAIVPAASAPPHAKIAAGMSLLTNVARWVVHNPPSMTLLAVGVMWGGLKLEPYGVPPGISLAAGSALLVATVVIRWKDWLGGR